MKRSFGELRAAMVRDDLRGRRIADERVLDAMATVPREAFVPEREQRHAYEDRPLPIGDGQTISQPYIVALMIELAELGPDDRMLEVGAGCGYAAAVAARVCAEVVGVERVHRLAVEADERVRNLGYANVRIVEGDGSVGWLPDAPYDAIVVSAGAPDVPPALVDQLAPGGRLVLPVGRFELGQRLVRVRRDVHGVHTEDLGGVAFVPLIGEAGWPR